MLEAPFLTVDRQLGRERTQQSDTDMRADSLHWQDLQTI